MPLLQIRLQSWLALAILMSIPTLVRANAQTNASYGSIDFQVLDSATGYAVGYAKISWAPAKELPLSTLPYFQVSSSNGRIAEHLSPGEYVFEISASGYKPLRTHFSVTPGVVVHSNINLDPVSRPPELRKDVISSELRNGIELVHGYVVDGLTYKPISNVKIKLEQGGKALTDARGYFQLYANAISTAKLSRPEDFPALDVLTAAAPGYKQYVLGGLLHVPGSAATIRIEMTPGVGTTARGIAHRPLMENGSLPNSPASRRNPIGRHLTQWLAAGGKALELNSQTSTTTATSAATTITEPSSIRVGSNCSSGKYGCTTTNTYSLETYVQEGLDNEWISSWNTNSLMAGSVAYRSYGAWFVANPICPTTTSSCPTVYDICASIYCQAFDSSTARTTVDAAKSTAGVVLSNDGVGIFFAEYSANTNGLYCPDGQTGQPALNWPCMLDPIAAGSTGSGHGRGMSQWGSQYWARGQSYTGTLTTPRDWRCILDHYYNANSNSITVDPSGTGSPGAGSGLRTAFMYGEPTYGTIAYEAYDSNGNITGIRAANAADGSGDHSIISGISFGPSWEPGGQRLAFFDGTGIGVVNADGTGLTHITSNGGCSPNQNT